MVPEAFLCPAPDAAVPSGACSQIRPLMVLSREEGQECRKAGRHAGRKPSLKPWKTVVDISRGPA
jgi:hypothetical protein